MQGQRLMAESSLEPLSNLRVRSDNVRLGSKADIGASVKDVRFTPKSGHNAERKNPSAHRPSSGVAVVRSESECRIENSPARRRVLGHA